jgi:hypothetical protein
MAGVPYVLLTLLSGASRVQGFSVRGIHLRSTQVGCHTSSVVHIPSHLLTPTPKNQLSTKCSPISRVKMSSSTNASDPNQDIRSKTAKGNSTLVTQVCAPLASTATIAALDILLRSLFRRAHIGFPSSLAGCGLLFMAMIGLNSVTSKWGDALHGFFSPGSALLAKWLPVFFVPSLVTLPLAPSTGSTVEVSYD